MRAGKRGQPPPAPEPGDEALLPAAAFQALPPYAPPPPEATTTTGGGSSLSAFRAPVRRPPYQPYQPQPERHGMLPHGSAPLAASLQPNLGLEPPPRTHFNFCEPSAASAEPPSAAAAAAAVLRVGRSGLGGSGFFRASSSSPPTCNVARTRPPYLAKHTAR